ncbi:F-box/WD repeat-containing protein 4-like [Mya arenaria]|uniref:F-box/WD repeat-containing protein 4-like n=1 Tax=Mya arenaria TaxID=6604 RepID=UPI0022E37A56|nr:F-box/WD repeat-containing protein 4-like [Mya arenaria]
MDFQSKTTQAEGKIPHPSICLEIIPELPDVALIYIFKKCDIKTLGRICRACKRFRDLVKLDAVWFRFSRYLLKLNSCDIGSKRCSLPLFQQYRLGHNWEEKKCCQVVLSKNNTRLIPWMQYNQNVLWISGKNGIRSFDVRETGRPRERKGKRLQLPNRHDVTRFVVKDNILLSGCRDGSVYAFDTSNGQCIQTLYKLHDTDAQAVDFHGDYIVSGSRDKTVKVTSVTGTGDQDCGPIKAVLNLRERVWSLALAQGGRNVAIGTAGCRGAPSLSVWNVERQGQTHVLGDYRYGAGVLDVRFEDDNTLLSCGYDACLRLWDLRTSTCVSEWAEPYDATVYCLQTDCNVAMVTGTAQHSMVRLWDKRSTQPVQEYFLSQKSPVYSVAFDSRRLFAALDLNTSYLDFS